MLLLFTFHCLVIAALLGAIFLFQVSAFQPCTRINKRSSQLLLHRSPLLHNKFSKLQQPLFAQTTEDNASSGFDLAAWFNPNTRGGVLVWSALLTLVPIAFYQYFISTGLEETTVGAYVGAIFVLLSNLLWASTYIFRVANKDMTYAKQLRDYENAVLQKRLEELADDEINALMEEIELEEKRTTTQQPAASTTESEKSE